MAKKYEQYEVEDGEIKDKKKTCLKCGPGVFMADHEDRWQCGKCGYTRFKSKD